MLLRLFSSSFRKTIIFTVFCLLLSALFMLLARYAEGFAQWYAATVYPVFPEVAGRVSSNWKYSFFEAGIVFFLLFAAVLTLLGMIIVILKKPPGSYFSMGMRFLLCFMSGLLLVYTLTGAVNYHRHSIGTVLNLPVTDSSKEALVKLSMILAEELTSLTKEPDWDYALLTVNDPAYIETQAVNAMKLLGKHEPSLRGYYPKPKPVFFSAFLSGLGIDGIFSPFTMEANYNQEITSFLIPYTICHELAHFKGYMKEDDAGFIAFLACRNSPSKVFRYSGMFHALTFSLNALKTETDADEFHAVYQNLPEPVRMQLGYVKEKRQLQATSLTPVAKEINDMYLKVNAQSGIKSYGKIVDLLIADYAELIRRKNLI